MRRKLGTWLAHMILTVSTVVGSEVHELSPLVVEAWHFDGLSLGIPAGVVRLERGEIENSGAVDIPEVLEALGGVRFSGYTGSGMEGQLSLRGFGENSGLRVLVLVDGQAYNPPDMGGINWLGLDVGELETVEILRGGQTVLYGNHAVSGVVKLRTRAPGEEPEGYLRVRTGSDSERRASTGLGIRSGKVGLRTGFSWNELAGYRDHSAASSRGGFLSWAGPGEGKSRWSGRFSYHRGKMEFPGPLTYGQLLADPRQQTGSGLDRAENDEWKATLRGEGTTGIGEWETAAAVMSRSKTWHLGGQDADNRLSRITLHPRIRLGNDGRVLVVGTDFQWDRVDDTRYLDPGRQTVSAWADIERRTVGAYLFGSIERGDGWQVSGGIRAERSATDNLYVHYVSSQLLPEVETNRGTFPNPDFKDPADPDPRLSFQGPVVKSGWATEVSLVKQLDKQTSVWCGWDRVYRYPSLDEAAAYQGFSLSEPLNSDLDPETGNNLEIGFKRRGHGWDTGLTAFWLFMDDEIGFFEGYHDGEWVRLNRNLGDTKRQGAELFFSYRKDNYGLLFNGGLVDARFRGDRSGEAVPLVPEKEASLSLWWKPSASLRLQVRGRYLSSQAQANGGGAATRIPSYFLAHFSLQLVLLDGATLSAGINNILDKTHAVSAYSGGFYPGNGRRAYAELTWKF